MSNIGPLKEIKKWLDKRAIRYYIMAHIKNYAEEKTYIIIDDRIEEYDESLFKLQKELGQIENYHISRPYEL